MKKKKKSYSRPNFLQYTRKIYTKQEWPSSYGYEWINFINKETQDSN